MLNRKSKLGIATRVACMSAFSLAASSIVLGQEPNAPAKSDTPAQVTPPTTAPTTAPARLERGSYLGLAATPPTPLKEQFGLPKGVGLVVQAVAADSPAQRAGLQVKDVLHKLNDQLVIHPQQLAVLVRSLKAGEEVKLHVIRDGQPQTLTATLGEKDVRALEDLRLGVDDAQSQKQIQDLQQALAIREQMMREQAKLLLQQFRASGGQLPRGFKVTRDDGETKLSVTQTEDGKRVVEVIDKDGKVQFKGPIDTPEQRRAVPEDIYNKLSRMPLPLVAGPTTAPTTSETNR